ncbi:MAG: VOC family protein [Alphaproteobacteria bacterium]|nr:VOC family protein [Alphaproteobacteria bacterium]
MTVPPATQPPETRHPGNLIACLRYRDAPAMIEWLCRHFGFQKKLIVPGGDGKVGHAELCYGTGMIMLGSLSLENDYSQHVTVPDAIGGKETQTIYVVVPDADLIYARARAGAAEMLIDIRDEAHGGRGFTCRDPEGHIWSFGTYDPWK